MEIKGKKSYSEAYEELLRCREYIESMTSKLESRNKELQDKKKELDDLYTKMYREEMDVTQLEKLSFSRIIAKIAGNYEDKYQKEYQEYINAKLKYDELNEFIIELQQDISRRKNEIKKEELNAKTIEESLVNDYIEGRERKEEIDQKKQLIYRQQTEIREAITAVMRVRDLTNKAIESYSSAKGWATYDTFFNGGLIADFAKYNKVDEAQKITNEIRAASNSMNKELSDVKIQFQSDIDTIDGGVRGFDMFFDNIFTDWSVRDRIEDNIGTLENYKSKLEHILQNLRSKENELKYEIKSLQL